MLVPNNAYNMFNGAAHQVPYQNDLEENAENLRPRAFLQPLLPAQNFVPQQLNNQEYANQQLQQLQPPQQIIMHQLQPAQQIVINNPQHQIHDFHLQNLDYNDEEVDFAEEFIYQL